MWPVQIWYGALKTHQQLFFCKGSPSSVGATPTHRNMRWSLNSRSAVISASCFMPLWWNGRHSRLKICCPYGRAGSSPASGTKCPRNRIGICTALKTRVLWVRLPPRIRPVGAIGRRAWVRPMFLKVQLLYWTLIFDFSLKLLYNNYVRKGRME